ncbi:MAG: tetratricopeptide repeat protein, partial [Candidatus Melainabacteria bacterium]|nr:tetratricopeptide repeat protein [Candidatus Melainabacteria bacterium]
MADDTVDEDSAQDGGEEDNEASKKTFGILAARFLQKGKSSPGSITGEFEALALPNSTSSSDPKVRKLQPIDDEDEEVREGSIHGMEVPLSESLYADIGLDDMSNFEDSAAESDSRSGVASFEEAAAPDVVYDIDAAEQPVISFGSGVEAEHAQDIELAISDNEQPAHYEEQAASYEEQANHHEEPTNQHEEQAVQHEEPAVQLEEHSDQTEEAKPEYQYATEEVAEIGAAPDYQYGNEEVASAIDAGEVEYAAESAAADEEVQSQYSESPYSETEPESEHAGEPAEESTAAFEAGAFDASSLDAIGTKAESDVAAFDKSALDQIGSEKEINDKIFVTNEPPPAPEKKGLLGKFAAKKDPAVRPLIGGSKKDVAPEPTGGKPFDAAALDSIGTKGFDAGTLDSIGSKGFDPGALDSIGTKGFDPGALDSIGTTKGFDAGALDSIGTKGFDAGTLDSIGTKGFDAGALDSIGTKGFDAGTLDSIGTKGFDAGALDSIGTKGFDKGALDSIGEPSTPAAEAKDKPKTGGLLGGKIGQKAKVLGSEKAKLGGIIPPSTDPTFDQKETGRFMVNASESAETMGASEGLTTAPSEDFSAPAADYSAPANDYSPPEEEAAQPAKEALSASFFDDDAKEPFVEEEHVPVIGSDEIGRLITDADNAYRLKQYKAAEPIFASVLEKLDKIGDDTDPLLPYCLDKMADNLFQMKKYKESLQFFRRLLVLHTKISSADRDMISTLYKIAQTSEALNLTSEADSMYKRAFRLGQQSLVPGDPLLAKVLEGYGTMLMRSEGAEPPAAASTAEKTAE